MQTVYEDGPRRDMRLWWVHSPLDQPRFKPDLCFSTSRIGDLRLQALCSYATFKDYDLAKRCLYLFAGMPFNDNGLLAACVYEKPTPHFGGNSIGQSALYREVQGTLLTLKFVGDDTEFIAAHVKQHIDACVDSDFVGSRDEFAVGGQAQLMSAGNDPLCVCRGQIPSKPEDARSQVSGVVDLAGGVFGA